MSHGRQQIRDAVAAVLNAVPQLAGRVFTNRRGALATDQVPAVLVSTPRETITPMLNKRERTLEITVEIVAAMDGADDALDDLAVLVENALDDNSLGNRVTDLRLESTDIAFTPEQEGQHGSARLTFSALYSTSLTDPETIT